MQQQWKLLIILKMKTKHIQTLAELREAKKKLKIKMAIADEKAREGFLYSTINKLFDSIENSSKTWNTPMSENIHSSLNFISNRATKKFNLGKTTQSIISIAILIGAPIIAKKIQDFIDDYE